MKPYIVKFNWVTETDRGKMNSEEMFLCLHAENPRDAFEKYLQVTGGESRQCYFVTINANGIELFRDRDSGKFFTIPTD